jgi:hypothetical protein
LRHLTGVLHRLGMVDLGYASAPAAGRDAAPGQRPLRAFRLTPAGKAMLDDSTAAEPVETDPGKLVVQPSFQLLAIGPVSPALLAMVDVFAEREQVDRGAFQYRLTRESVYRGLQLGLDVATITRLLTEASGIELPQNVRRSLEEWATHHERVVFRTGVSLLQAAGAELLAEIMQGAATGPLLARAVAPDVALVRDKNAQGLVSALVEQGQFPAVSDASPQAADKSVTIQEDGTIRPIHAVPSLHLCGRLTRLAEEVDGGWRLTATSVRRAGGSRNKVLSLLEELGKLHRGPLPDRLVEQVKAWGGYYGNAAAETLTLIEFANRTALDELAQQPDLRALLTPFSAGERALAAVADGNLAQVSEILARYGVRVAGSLRH